MNEEKFIRTYNEEKFCDAKCDGLDSTYSIIFWFFIFYYFIVSIFCFIFVADIEKTRSSYFAPLGSFLNTMSNMSLDSYCKMVCRGRACKNCSPDQFLSDPSSPLHSSPLLGLNASWWVIMSIIIIFNDKFYYILFSLLGLLIIYWQPRGLLQE